MKANNGSYTKTSVVKKTIQQPITTGSVLSTDKNQTHQIEQKANCGSFTINFMKQEEGSKLFIYDHHGNHIIESMSLNQGLKEININNQPKGIYFIKIIKGNKKNISKVVIQ